MRTKPAHKSLITDVQKASSPPLRNHPGKILAGKATDRTRSAPALTEDIRAIQRTQGPYAPLDCFVANAPRNAGWTAPDGICCAKLRVLNPSEETVRHER